MKKNSSIFAVLILLSGALGYTLLTDDPKVDLSFVSTPSTNHQTIYNAYLKKNSDVQLGGRGTVIKTLPDDLKGSKHQKFILEIDHGMTVLISHNIDLAPRVQNLKKDDVVEFYGEYEWNSKGGVVHWTHKDSKQRHPNGWLKHNGKVYQ